jgi:hypothetical protein
MGDVLVVRNYVPSDGLISRGIPRALLVGLANETIPRWEIGALYGYNTRIDELV